MYRKVLAILFFTFVCVAGWSQQIVENGNWVAVIGPITATEYDAYMPFDDNPYIYERVQLSYDQIETLRIAMGKYPTPRSGIQWYMVNLRYYYHESTSYVVIAGLRSDGRFNYKAYRARN